MHQDLSGAFPGQEPAGGWEGDAVLEAEREPEGIRATSGKGAATMGEKSKIPLT